MNIQHCAVTDGRLHIGWDEKSAALDGDVLRLHCRCSECRSRDLRGESRSHAEQITVLAVSPMGYGLQLHFSDGHNRGVFPWSYLIEIAAEDMAGENG
jgi:DUF971 family protein